MVDRGGFGLAARISSYSTDLQEPVMISEGRNWSIPTLVSTAVDNIMPETGYNHERLWNTGSPSRSGR